MNAIFAWLWQGAAIALATATLLGAMRRLNAATRHAIWWCALGAVLAAPLVRAALEAPAATGMVATAALPARAVVLPALPDFLIAMAIGAWLGTLLVGFGRIATGLRLLARLRSESTPLDAERESRLPMWQAAAAAGHRRAHLRVSPRAHAACALGLFEPVILLSHALVDTLDDEALDQVVMHEYAHLLRHDDWLRLLESLIVSVVGLHPAIRFMARQIDLEREAACDDVVVSGTGGARAYAACLADAAAIAGRDTTGVERLLVPNATGRTVSLRARVLRLLDPRRARTARMAPAAIAVGLLTVMTAIALSHHVAPILIVDDHATVTAPPVPRASVAQAAAAAPAARTPDEGGAAPSRTAVNIGRSVVQQERARVLGSQTISSVQLAPSEVVSRLSIGVPDVAPAPLASSSITSDVHTTVALTDSVVRGLGVVVKEGDGGVKWSSLGAPGVAVGRGAKSIAGFFGGAAKAVAASF